MAAGTASVKVFKFDPAVDKEPRYDRYDVPYEDGATALDILNYIYENHDPNLSFRFCCKKGKCGSCPVSVNGRPTFSCHEPATSRMVIGPHPKFKVIKDLVVDFDELQKVS